MWHWSSGLFRHQKDCVLCLYEQMQKLVHYMCRLGMWSYSRALVVCMLGSCGACPKNPSHGAIGSEEPAELPMEGMAPARRGHFRRIKSEPTNVVQM